MQAIVAGIPGLHFFRQVAFHALVSGLAVGIAFSLPSLAKFVLHDWWPRMMASSKMLLATELGLAAALVLLFNGLHLAWEGVRAKRTRDQAALVRVRRDGEAPVRGGSGKPARDAIVVSVTGFHTFAGEHAPFRELLDRCYEARVLLLNPGSEGARERIRSLPDPAAAGRLYREETAASIARLAALRDAGRRVSLKLYDRAPFWSVVVAGDEAWVRYCHDGYPLSTQPDYVFRLRHDDPTQGLFPPFCRYAIDQWNDPAHAEYDFATGELVRRAADGTEVREPFAA